MTIRDYIKIMFSFKHNIKDIIHFIDIVYKGRIFTDSCVIYPEVSMGVIFVLLSHFFKYGHREGIISFFQFRLRSWIFHIFSVIVFMTSIVTVFSFVNSLFKLCKTHHSITSQVGVGGISIVIVCPILIFY